MNDRQCLEECYKLVCLLKNGKRERQMKKMLEYQLGRATCERIKNDVMLANGIER